MRLGVWLGAVGILAASSVVAAPQEPQVRQQPVVGQAIKHDVSLPLRLMKPLPPSVAPAREVPNRNRDYAATARPAPLAHDPLLAPVIGPQAPMPAPIITFEGTSNDDNAAVVGGRIVPPDTEGDVGPTHYVQWNNLVYEVFNKTTGATVLGPVAGNALWSGFGGDCETLNDGDPIVLYDQFADRWMLSQFAVFNNNGIQCIAVSTTSDPTGSYYRYAFDISAGMNDYPKMGVWPDGYYLTYNEFDPFGGAVAVVFDRAKMLSGLAATFQKFTMGCSGVECYFGVLPSHVEGMNPPPAGAPNYFVMAYDDEWQNNTAPYDPNYDFYKIWEFHVDWTTPANSTFTGPVSLQSPEFDSNMCGGSRNCIPQPGTTIKLDALQNMTMYRAAYMNYGDHESILVTNTVDVANNDHAGVRWAEIRNPGGTPVLYQAGTHAPDSEHRWMSSGAMDVSGNMAIGYSLSSSSTYPSIRYAGRLAGDPLGTLPQTETEMFAGTGSQTNTYYRWGDYSSMSLDESDGCTFWYTNEYSPTNAAWSFHTRIGAFRFPTCASTTGTLTGTVTNSATTNPISGATVQANGSSATTGGTGVYTMYLAPATYDVTASATGYVPETVTGVVITDGVTTTQDFALDPCPTITVSPSTIPAGTAGVAYSQTFTQTGGVGTITWSVTGTLPTGLSLDTSTGELAGTPTQVGSFPITITATDSNGCTGSVSGTLVIARLNPFVPTALAVDAAGNGVLDTGETATVAPSWRNDTGAPETVTGTASDFTGPTATYTIPDAAASYGTVAAGATASCSSTGNCYGVRVGTPATRPVQHWDATFLETLSGSDAKTWTLHVGESFADVPKTNAYYRFVETIFHRSVTGGCTSTNYCPNNSTTRGQMAIFALIGKEGAAYSPVACGTTPLFTDVPVGSVYCKWVEEIARRGIAGGCTATTYCPNNAVTRGQMAIFMLRTLDPALDPPACTTPMFADVPASSPYCKWVEELARRGVVSGCGSGNYCPANPVTRGQMGVFITQTFALTLYGI